MGYESWVLEEKIHLNCRNGRPATAVLNPCCLLSMLSCSDAYAAMAIAGSPFVYVTYSMDATRGLLIAGTVSGALQQLFDARSLL